MFVVIVSLLANIYQFSHLRYLSPKDGTNCLDVKLEQIRLGFNHKKALILLRYCSKLCYYDNLLYNNKKKNKKKLNYINNIYVYIYIYMYIYIYINNWTLSFINLKDGEFTLYLQQIHLQIQKCAVVTYG